MKGLSGIESVMLQGMGTDCSTFQEIGIDHKHDKGLKELDLELNCENRLDLSPVNYIKENFTS